MDFDFYRNFITVAETGNLTTASKKLSLAQPALSAQIKTLEDGTRQTPADPDRSRGSLPEQSSPDLPHRRNAAP